MRKFLVWLKGLPLLPLFLIVIFVTLFYFPNKKHEILQGYLFLSMKTIQVENKRAIKYNFLSVSVVERRDNVEVVLSGLIRPDKCNYAHGGRKGSPLNEVILPGGIDLIMRNKLSVVLK